MTTALVLTTPPALALEIPGDARQMRDELVAAAAEIAEVSDPFTLEVASEQLRALAAFAKRVEASRVEVKKPFLDATRTIDSTAATFVAVVKAQEDRLRKLISAHLAAERERQRKAEEAAAAERRRLEEEQRRKEEEARQAAKRALEAKNEAERKQAAEEVERAAAAARQAQAEKVAAAPVAVVQAPPQGLASRAVLGFVVEDIGKLYAARPDLVDLVPNKQAIRREIANGARSIPGLKIEETQNLTVRTA